MNLATYNTDQNFNVNYTFSLNFTSPSNAFDTQVFNLNIQQTTNPSPDNVFNISQAMLNNLGPFTQRRDGFRHSFVEYGDGWYDGSKWINPEGGTSTLKIVADFTAVIAPPGPGTVDLGDDDPRLRRRRLHGLSPQAEGKRSHGCLISRAENNSKAAPDPGRLLFVGIC